MKWDSIKIPGASMGAKGVDYKAVQQYRRFRADPLVKAEKMARRLKFVIGHVFNIKDQRFIVRPKGRVEAIV